MQTPDKPYFEQQQKKLSNLSGNDLKSIVATFQKLKLHRPSDEMMHSETFVLLLKNLYDLELIFPFPWMNWEEGWKNLEEPDFSFSQCSLLTLSMYLTAIFRADRFNDSVVQYHLETGTLDKIFAELESHIHKQRT